MNRLIKNFLFIATVLLGVVVFIPSTSYAQQSGSNFRADHIIDDSVFYNGNSMTAAQIQQFLNSKVPVCDTNGTTGPYYDSSGRRWNSRGEFGASRGSPPPYTCLKDFRQNTPAKSDSGLCAPIPARSNRTAAQIIDDVARACNVSQKALIVTLEKEQSFITDTWPWPIQYQKAMGYYCPDDPSRPGWCHPDYAGFFNQVYNAARQFQRYKQSPSSFNHAINRTSYVAYQANAPSCGGTNLTMRTAATAALYNYTPYQPNQAALNNLYGTGNSCSAYGNRNFWRLFNDWFGSTTAINIPIKGSIKIKYDAIDGPNTLGSPLKPEVGGANGLFYQQFEKGYIIGSYKNGYYLSMGAIRDKWRELGFQNGSLGLPISDISIDEQNQLWTQNYQGGVIKTVIGGGGRYAVKGSIYRKIIETNGRYSSPEADEYTDGSGFFWQQFTNGYIVGKYTTGYYESTGSIRKKWGEIGYQNSPIGLPTSDIVETSPGCYSQEYELGTISGCRGEYIVSTPSNPPQ